MPTIKVEIVIAAPPMRCFDLARSVEAHLASVAHTGEQAVAGKTRGLLALGDRVTWRARHFGIVQELTSEITKFDPPVNFQDTMVRGAFASLVHDHYFSATPSGTRMLDVLTYSAPLGPLGRLAEILFLTRYMRGFLERRGRALKTLAEAESDNASAPIEG